ncbi:MAG: histidine--tRNA ligase [Bradymonadales bacterium]|nr:MAG: histidine--tRNA ligase [Bradymonadales bacterium]
MGKVLSTKPASGFRDFLGAESRKRSDLIRKIESVYRSFGFESLETPALENLEVLLGSGGQENEKLIFKTLKRGEKLERALEQKCSESDLSDLGLRFDLTVPLCRVVAEYSDKIPLPWKVFHFGPVWRAERPQKARYREFYQCDVDVIGTASQAAELEVIEALYGAFEACGVSSLELRLSDRRLLAACANAWGFGDRLGEFAIILDKKDKQDTEALAKELRELLGKALPRDLERALHEKVSLEEAVVWSQGAGESLFKLIEQLQDLSKAKYKVEFDLSLVRGMGYYTGVIFEWMQQGTDFALGGGGRYDDLTSRFMKRAQPAVGGSLGFERLLLLLESESESETNQPVFFPVMEESLRRSVTSVAREFQKRGLAVDLFVGEAKMKSQLKYASQKNYRWVVFLGEEELRTGKFKIKDFRSGDEKSFSSLEEAVEAVRRGAAA